MLYFWLKCVTAMRTEWREVIGKWTKKGKKQRWLKQTVNTSIEPVPINACRQTKCIWALNSFAWLHRTVNYISYVSDCVQIAFYKHKHFYLFLSLYVKQRRDPNPVQRLTWSNHIMSVINIFMSSESIRTERMNIEHIWPMHGSHV